MNKAAQVNAVALSMQTVMRWLDQFFDGLVGRGQHNVVLLVGAGDVVQYSSNTPRPHAVKMLQDLLARWSLGMPDTLPGETTPGDTRAFEYLLNEFQRQAQLDAGAGGPDLASAHAELVTYVGALLAKLQRGGNHGG